MWKIFSEASKSLKRKYLRSRSFLLSKEIAFYEEYISITSADPGRNGIRKIVSKIIQNTRLPDVRDELKLVKNEMMMLRHKRLIDNSRERKI